MQRKVYKGVLMRDIDTINGTSSGRTAILNIVMQLRKCCNHPYLFPNTEDRNLDPMGEHLVENCGKVGIQRGSDQSRLAFGQMKWFYAALSTIRSVVLVHAATIIPCFLHWTLLSNAIRRPTICMARRIQLKQFLSCHQFSSSMVKVIYLEVERPIKFFLLFRGPIDRIVCRTVIFQMILLDKLLTRLKAAGHRVLVFSQMTRMMDILEDLMHMRGEPPPQITDRDFEPKCPPFYACSSTIMLFLV